MMSMQYLLREGEPKDQAETGDKEEQRQKQHRSRSIRNLPPVYLYKTNPYGRYRVIYYQIPREDRPGDNIKIRRKGEIPRQRGINLKD
ncbi:hypothetical protein C922_04445 [Plasmodium inui San Antonio 1]|uniref:Uncharacterized protein n=1 Tax=Plasmodium inui San Antonio 1 TaxID=1237626 RepID=W7A7R0_9APIC|nr:hypothetical protein C922_04445 [Plasmodium inui San Antonio 1]EUD65159.1 hypothetical protein C922_04445 [Plasmodium inui San Antonio 1]